MRDPLPAVKAVVKTLTPPPVLDAWRRLRQRPEDTEWVYEPAGWSTADAAIKGWNVLAVAHAELERWPGFLLEVEGTSPIGVSHENPDPETGDIMYHNTIMCFAYAFGRAAWGKSSVRVLDWGGGLGYYYRIARALFPDVQIEYTCKDLPHMVRAGRDLQPALRFVEDEHDAFDRPYDFVLASGSLQYTEDWDRILRRLAGVTQGYLLITRLPSVVRTESFVVRQRAYAYGYDTEYLCWCLNQTKFLDAVRACGLRLERQFTLGEQFLIPNAPELVDCRGFLFRTV